MKKRRITAVGLALCLLGAILCGCGQQGRTPEEVIQAAIEKVGQANGMKYEMELDLSLQVKSEVLNQELHLKAEAEMLSTKDPLMVQMDMDVNLGAFGEVETLVYGQEQADGTILLQTSTDGGKTFVTSTADLSEIKQYNASASMKQFLTGITKGKDMGKESVDGRNATRYDAVITGENMKEVLEASGALNQFAEAGMEDVDLSALYDSIEAISISLWIDTETDEILRYSVDLTEMLQGLMQEVMDQLPGGETVSILVEKAVAELHDIQLDPEETIAIPDEALEGGTQAGDSPVGRWMITGVEMNGVTMNLSELEEWIDDENFSDGVSIVFELKEDGTLHAEAMGETAEGTWRAAGEAAYVLTIEGEDQKVSLEDGSLVLEMDGGKMLFGRA